jgi:pyruvate dehydrogenase E1 component
VNIVAMGSVVSEAAEAVRLLISEEVAANLVVVSSAERLAAETHDGRLAAIRGRAGHSLGHLETLFPVNQRRAPMVTVLDGASHALSFVGSVFGASVVPLGVDTFGQSGTIPDLYADAGIDANHIFEAALLAIEIG